MSKHEFLHSTMRDVNLRIKAYQEEKEYKAKEIEYQSWLTGLYVQNAVASCFNKKAKYPKNPLETEYVVVEDMELTEEEAEKWRKKLFHKLRKKSEKKDSETGAGEN